MAVVTDPGGLKPPQIHQIKAQTTPKTQYSSLARRSLLSSGRKAVHWRAGNENSRIWSFHLDTLRVPTLVPHPALQPGAEVVDPSKGKRRFPRVRGAGIRPSGAGF